jgi:chemotaxis protein MotB
VLGKNLTADSDDTLRETQSWLPTYAVLCMTLLALFVMLRVLSGFEAYKDNSQAQLHRQLVDMQRRAFNDISAFLVKNGMEADIEVVLEEDAILLRLPEGMLFAPGDDQILLTGFNALNQLKELFTVQHQQTITIRGHTDDSPLPPGARFRDSGELSALRAVQILRHMLAQGIEPWRLTATGFGALEPLFPNTTEMNRAKNRRMEFVLERRLGKE